MNAEVEVWQNQRELYTQVITNPVPEEWDAFQLIYQHVTRSYRTEKRKPKK